MKGEEPTHSHTSLPGYVVNEKAGHCQEYALAYTEEKINAQLWRFPLGPRAASSPTSPVSLDIATWPGNPGWARKGEVN